MTVKGHRLLADGDMVVALTEAAVGNETAYDADVFTLRDGKMTRVQVRTDTAVMERVYARNGSPAGNGSSRSRPVATNPQSGVQSHSTCPRPRHSDLASA